MIKNFIVRNKTIISYAFFGVLTTLINIFAYILFYEYFKVPNTISNIIAWVVAVAFAFITNKLYVFESKHRGRAETAREIFSFLCARVATGLLDFLIMFLAVNIFEKEPVIFKVISNIIVIICNYVFSKIFVFKKSKNKQE